MECEALGILASPQKEKERIASSSEMAPPPCLATKTQVPRSPRAGNWGWDGDGDTGGPGRLRPAHPRPGPGLHFHLRHAKQGTAGFGSVAGSKDWEKWHWGCSSFDSPQAASDLLLTQKLSIPPR